MGGKRGNHKISNASSNNMGAKRGKFFPMTSYGVKGLMISCSTSKVKESEGEVFSYLDEWIEKLYPNIINHSSSNEELSISSAFAAELKELKSKSTTKSLYERMDLVFGGLYFIHLYQRLHHSFIF